MNVQNNNGKQECHSFVAFVVWVVTVTTATILTMYISILA